MGIADFMPLIVLIVLFACAVWAAFYICDKAGFPQPVRWIVGLIFLLALFYFLSSGNYIPHIGGHGR